MSKKNKLLNLYNLSNNKFDVGQGDELNLNETTQSSAIAPATIFEISDSKIRIKFQFLYKCIRELLFLTLFFIFSNAKIANILSPFSVAFAFALLCAGEKPYFFSLSFLLSQLAFSFSVQCLIINSAVVSAIFVCYFILKLSKTKTPIWLCLFFQILSSVGYFYYNHSNSIEIVQSFLLLILTSICLYIFYIGLKTIFIKGLFSKMAFDEKLCISFFVPVIALGIFGIELFGISFSTICFCFLILFLSRIQTRFQTLLVAFLIGVGVAFQNANVTFLAVIMSWGCISCVLAKYNKIFTAFGILCVDFMLGTYFNCYIIYSYQNIIAIGIPILIFLCIPAKIYNSLNQKIGNCFTETNYLFEFERKQIKSKMQELSVLFSTIGSVYQRLTKFDMCENDLKKSLTNDIISRMCKNCSNFELCMRQKNMHPDIRNLVDVATTKEKVSLIDISKNIASNCIKTSSLIACTNSIASNFKQYENLLQNEDKGRFALAEQFVGTSEILKNFSSQFSKLSNTNGILAKKISNELLCFNIETKDELVLENEFGVEKVILVVKCNSNIKVIGDVLLDIIKVRFIHKIYASNISGWEIVEFSEKPKYELSVGFSVANKNGNEISGDSYLFSKLDDDKFLISICDGMGTGNQAQETSENTILLIESFYKSNFSSEVILNSIAKLLSTSGRETFSTLDVAVFNSKTGTCDFAKASAPATIIKRKNESILLECESLPMGIVDKSSPNTYKQLLESGDIVIMASDGIVDSFGSVEEYQSFCNNEKLVNMSLLSESIKEEALALCGGIAKDDMTCICMRVL